MNKTVILALSLGSLSLSGCAVVGVALMPVWVPAWGIAEYNQSKRFRVTSGNKNISLAGVQKGMLECGFKNPRGDGMTENERIEASFCMERAGLRYGSVPMERVCESFAKKNYPACRPGEVIPVPSVARRLNSPYCKDKVNKNKPECRP